jgi:hypothetical protein
VSLGILLSCAKDEPFIRNLPGVPNAFISEIRYIDHSNSILHLQVDIAAITHSDYDYTFLSDSAFKIQDNAIYDFTIDSIDRIERVGGEAYTNMLLVDLSDSYNDSDPFNMRLRAINKFLQEVSVCPSAKCGLAHYNRDTSGQAFYILTNNGNPFTVPYQQSVIEQFWSTYFVENTSNMYDATYEVFKYFDAYASGENNSITLFAHELDDGLGMTYQALIDSALYHHIKINIISIEEYQQVFANITASTGGFLSIIDARSIAESMDKGTPMLASLHRILSEETFVYRLHITVQRNAGSFAPGTYIRHLLKVQEYNSDNEEIIYNPLYIYNKIPVE